MTTETISDEEAFHWLNNNCMGIRIGNASREYIGSWTVNQNLLDVVKFVMIRLNSDEKDLVKG